MKTEGWSDASVSQGTPEIAGKPPEARKSQRITPTGFRGRLVLQSNFNLIVSRSCFLDDASGVKLRNGRIIL